MLLGVPLLTLAGNGWAEDISSFLLHAQSVTDYLRDNFIFALLTLSLS